MTKEIRNLILIFSGVIVIAFLGYYFILSAQPKYVTEEKTSAIPSMPMVGNLASGHSFSSGPIDAKVTVVEFFDPECSACAAVAPIIKKEMQHYEGRVRWVFRYMAFHHNSKTAIRILEAARQQKLFLQTQEALFEKRETWGEKQVSTEDEILNVVKQVKGLNFAELKSELSVSKADELLQRDTDEGHQAGVNGTPTFFVNGVMLEPLNLDELIARIDAGLK